MAWRYFLLLAVLTTSGLHAAGPLDDKGPPYFVDRYGHPQSSQNQSHHVFLATGRGGITVKGPFSVREFRQGKLRVEAVFFVPSLKTAAVVLRLNQAWTDEQLEAALKAYGGQWKPIQQNIGAKIWKAPDGTVAIYSLNSLRIQSRTVIQLVNTEISERDGKQEAVPQF